MECRGGQCLGVNECVGRSIGELRQRFGSADDAIDDYQGHMYASGPEMAGHRFRQASLSHLGRYKGFCPYLQRRECRSDEREQTQEHDCLRSEPDHEGHGSKQWHAKGIDKCVRQPAPEEQGGCCSG
jgi:hypothetical protein